VEIKADPALALTKLVMMTSLGRRGDAARLKNIGFYAYLTKPVKKSILQECLVTVASGEQRLVSTDENARIITRHSIAEDRRRRVRILLADDNVTNQVVGLAILKRLGFRAHGVANGQEVLDALEKTVYDLVLMDCQMPLISGYEATRVIRSWQFQPALVEQDEQTSHLVRMSQVPIIALTANAMTEDRSKCIEAGMDDYLAKPVIPAQLITIIEKWLLDIGTTEHEASSLADLARFKREAQIPIS